MEGTLIVESRVKNTKRNIVSGLFRQVISLGLAFLTRTAVLYLLGAEYQGLSGLFTSILSVLNMTDLGVSTAIVFILYEPIANKNYEAVCSIMNFLKKIYCIIGAAIFTIGIGLIPFLDVLITGDVPDSINIKFLFVLYLVNSSISYFLFAYKSALLTAFQREDVVSNVYTISSLICKVIQLVVLVLTRDYYLFVLITVIGTVANNLLIQHESKKLFPNIIPMGKLPEKIKTKFSAQIGSVFIGRVGDIARNAFDNIVISTFLGLVVVAKYDNYYYIFNSLYGVMVIIIHSIIASVGNSIASEKIEKNYHDMIIFNFLFMLIVGWATICMACLYQPFMMIWMRNDSSMLLSELDMFLFCIYFYSINMTYVRSMYLDGKGLFKECRTFYIVEALGNLFLNLLLGYLFGVTGVLLATIITIFMFNFIGRNKVLFKHYFMCSSFEFYKEHFLLLLATIFGCALTYTLSVQIKIYGFLGLFIRLICCMVIPFFIYFVVLGRTEYFKMSIGFVKRIIKKT